MLLLSIELIIGCSFGSVDFKGDLCLLQCLFQLPYVGVMAGGAMLQRVVGLL